jgi:hypothetical protein
MGDEWGGAEIVIPDPAPLPWRHRVLLRVLDVLAGWLHRGGRTVPPPPNAKRPPRAP